MREKRVDEVKVISELTEQQKAELDALAEMPDEEIDFSDIPEGPLNPAKIKRAMFYIPIKHEITLTLDEYVVNWFEKWEPDDKARREAINRVLVAYIENQGTSSKKGAKESADSKTG